MLSSNLIGSSGLLALLGGRLWTATWILVLTAVVASTPRERGACRQPLNFLPNAGEWPKHGRTHSLSPSLPAL